MNSTADAHRLVAGITRHHSRLSPVGEPVDDVIGDRAVRVNRPDVFSEVR